MSEVIWADLITQESQVIASVRLEHVSAIEHGTMGCKLHLVGGQTIEISDGVAEALSSLLNEVYGVASDVIEDRE